jgi:hypothetical protein
MAGSRIRPIWMDSLWLLVIALVPIMSVFFGMTPNINSDNFHIWTFAGHPSLWRSRTEPRPGLRCHGWFVGQRNLSWIEGRFRISLLDSPGLDSSVLSTWPGLLSDSPFSGKIHLSFLLLRTSPGFNFRNAKLFVAAVFICTFPLGEVTWRAGITVWRILFENVLWSWALGKILWWW